MESLLRLNLFKNLTISLTKYTNLVCDTRIQEYRFPPRRDSRCAIKTSLEYIVLLALTTKCACLSDKTAIRLETRIGSFIGLYRPSELIRPHLHLSTSLIWASVLRIATFSQIFALTWDHYQIGSSPTKWAFMLRITFLFGSTLFVFLFLWDPDSFIPPKNSKLNSSPFI